MTTSARLAAIGLAARNELRTGILPFWASRDVDLEHGGFFGRIDAEGRPDPTSGKGGVLNARILWSFSAAQCRWPDDIGRQLADRAFDYLIGPFWDREFSGLYWEVDSVGDMLRGRKQTYCQAFGIYGLAEYFRATGVAEALDRAKRLFDDIETHALDPRSGGYWEARGRGWEPIADIRLSEIDMNAPFSMNTHLHLLEAYTGLVRVWDSPRPRERLRALLEIMLERVIDPETGHLILFYDEDWRPMSRVLSFGHDIEASWLLCEAADVLADERLTVRARAAALRLADGVLARGYDHENGGVYYEASPDGHVNTDKDWWPQAEAVVGFLNAFSLSGRREYLDAALQTWDLIDRRLIDHGGGEWFTRLTREGEPIPGLDKVDFWKCPYHNTRAMIEVDERAHSLASAG